MGSAGDELLLVFANLLAIVGPKKSIPS